jgi:hypothetical protein
MRKQLQQHLVAQNTSGWSKRDLLKIDGSLVIAEGDYSGVSKVKQQLYLLSDREIKVGASYTYDMSSLSGKENDIEVMVCQDEAEAKRCNDKRQAIRLASKRIEAAYPAIEGIPKITDSDMKVFVECGGKCVVWMNMHFVSCTPIIQDGYLSLEIEPFEIAMANSIIEGESFDDFKNRECETYPERFKRQVASEYHKCTCSNQIESDNCTKECDHTYQGKTAADSKPDEVMSAQPFEKYPELKDSIQHMACHAKIDMYSWTNHLQRINEVIEQLENATLSAPKVKMSAEEIAQDYKKQIQLKNEGWAGSLHHKIWSLAYENNSEEAYNGVIKEIELLTAYTQADKVVDWDKIEADFKTWFDIGSDYTRPSTYVNWFKSRLGSVSDKGGEKVLFKGFWKRLEMFVSNVKVNDPISEEEKEMILFHCKQQQPPIK